MIPFSKTKKVQSSDDTLSISSSRSVISMNALSKPKNKKDLEAYFQKQLRSCHLESSKLAQRNQILVDKNNNLKQKLISLEKEIENLKLSNNIESISPSLNLLKKITFIDIIYYMFISVIVLSIFFTIVFLIKKITANDSDLYSYPRKIKMKDNPKI